jgi:hypothetical protein
LFSRRRARIGTTRALSSTSVNALTLAAGSFAVPTISSSDAVRLPPRT